MIHWSQLLLINFLSSDKSIIQLIVAALGDIFADIQFVGSVFWQQLSNENYKQDVSWGMLIWYNIFVIANAQSSVLD